MHKPAADRYETLCGLSGADNCKHFARHVLHEYKFLTCEVEDLKGVLKLLDTPLREGAAAPTTRHMIHKKDRLPTQTAKQVYVQVKNNV